MELSLRDADREDAALLARVICMAGEGLPLVLWQSVAGPGGDPWAVGLERAARDTGGFSWRNARIAELDGHAVGGIVTYLTPDAPEEITPDIPAMFVPLVELENMVPATRYINALAVFPEARRHGAGRALMEEALARPGANGCSLIVADGNARAQAFYVALGFSETARRPIIPGDWETPNREWVLMARR